ncbi:MAG: dienelactone hydrolase family protein [Devosia sp.]|nr:dienelactone hydrolase family protein [Devosia sp.]
MTEITIMSAGHAIPAYLEIPAGQGPWPGIVVLHDALGQSGASRQQVDWLAASGYLAIAPDLFSRDNKLLCLLAVSRQLAARHGTAFNDIEAARVHVMGAQTAPVVPGSWDSA